MFVCNPLWNPLRNACMFLKSIDFVQKASHNKNWISVRFCLKSIELGKPSKSRPFDPQACLQQCIVRFELQFRYPFWTLFQISQHCTVGDKIMTNRQIRELGRASVHF